jgi:hypothetical protein
MVAREQGDYARAQALYEESMGIWRSLDDQVWKAFVSLGLGITQLLDGRYAKARAPLEEAQSLYERLGDRYGLAIVATEIAHLDRATGDHDHAIMLLGNAVHYLAAIGASDALSGCIELLATFAAERDEGVVALHLFGAIESARSSLGLPPSGERDANLIAAGKSLAKRSGGKDAESHLAAGRLLTLDQARDEALRFVASVVGCAQVQEQEG